MFRGIRIGSHGLRCFSKKVEVCEKLKIKQIPNPNGLEANKVMLFSNHDNDRIMPVGLLHQNKDYQTDVKVIYPKNTLVGIDVYYTPISTLGQIHLEDKEISGACLISYSLYNDKVQQLGEIESESNENRSEIYFEHEDKKIY